MIVEKRTVHLTNPISIAVNFLTLSFSLSNIFYLLLVGPYASKFLQVLPLGRPALLRVLPLGSLLFLMLAWGSLSMRIIVVCLYVRQDYLYIRPLMRYRYDGCNPKRRTPPSHARIINQKPSSCHPLQSFCVVFTTLMPILPYTYPAAFNGLMRSILKKHLRCTKIGHLLLRSCR